MNSTSLCANFIQKWHPTSHILCIYIQAIEFFFWICKSNFHNKSGRRIIAKVQSNQKRNFQYPAIVWHAIKHFNRMANECCSMFFLIFCFAYKYFFSCFRAFQYIIGMNGLFSNPFIYWRNVLKTVVY